MLQTKKFDPRTLLLVTTCFSSMAIFLNQLPLLVGVSMAILLFMLVLHIPVKRSLQRLYRFLRIFLPIIILQSIFNPAGEIIFALGPVRLLTTNGLQQGILLLLRMTIIILAATLLSLTKPREFIQGLVQLKMPYEIAFMVSVAMRFLPILRQEIGDALVAIQLRGLDIHKLPWRKRLKIYSSLFLPIVLSTLQRARHLAIAMELRAFRAYPTRSSYYHLTLQKRDYILMLSVLVVTVTIFFKFV